MRYLIFKVTRISAMIPKEIKNIICTVKPYFRREGKQEGIKVVSLVKKAENLPSIPGPLNCRILTNGHGFYFERIGFNSQENFLKG